MHVFNSRADFDAQMKSVKKWMRTGQALDGVARPCSTTWRTPSATRWCTGGSMPARPQPPIWSVTVAIMPWLAPLDGDLTVEVAPQGRPHLHPRLQRYR